MKTIAPVVLVLGLLGGMFFAAGCGGGSSSTTAALRVTNANGYTIGTTGYDYLVASASFATGVTFNNTSPYANVTSGSQTFEVRNSGTSTDLIDTTETFTGGDSYTFVTIGAATETTGVLLTDQTTAATTGDFQLRFVNASSFLPNVDIYVVDSSGNCSQQYLDGVSAKVTNLAFGSGSGYQTFTAGTDQLCITPTGQKIPFFTGGNGAYASGAVETIIIEDNGGQDRCRSRP